MRRWIVLLVVLGIVLVACDQADDDPLPTAVNPTELAATAGILPPQAVEGTLTARSSLPTEAITEVLTATGTPTHVVPTETDTATPTATELPTQVLTDTPAITATSTLPPEPTQLQNPAVNRIVFSSNPAGTADIWVIGFDGIGLKPILVSPGVQEGVITCHPDGAALAFDVTRNGEREIDIIEFPDLTARALSDTAGENYAPAWRPDGTQIAFISSRNGLPDLWLMDSGGANARQLTNTVGLETKPAWHPDGSQIWYAAFRDGNFDLFIYDLATDSEAPFTITPNQSEREPALSPDGQRVAFIDDTTQGDPSTASVFVADIETGEQRLVAAGDGPLSAPVWIDNTTLVIAAALPDAGTALLRVNLETNETQILTPTGFSHLHPAICYLPPGVLSNLPDLPTPTPGPTAIPSPTATPEPASLFDPVADPPENWLISSETWIGDEMAFVAPRQLQQYELRAFLQDNLINLVWEDAAGTHVLTMAMEPYRGALEVTLIGYTVDDFPGPPDDIEGLDVAMQEQILVNSLRPGPYHLENVEITDVNVTFSFRVPPVQLDSSASTLYESFGETAPGNWLISTERFTTDEIAQLIAGQVNGPVFAAFSERQMTFNWSAEGVAHNLVVEPRSTAGDLVLAPISYTQNGADALANLSDDILFILREGILTYSIPPGQFQLARVTLSSTNAEFVFLLPPAFVD